MGLAPGFLLISIVRCRTFFVFLNIGLAYITFFSPLLNAQAYPITDRSFAYATPAPMDKGHIMLEYGYFDVDALGGFDGLSINGLSMLTRFGIYEGLELRVSGGWTRLSQPGSANSSHISGMSSIKTGMKTGLVTESKYTPAISLIAEIEWPLLAKQAFRPQRFATHIRLIAEKFLNERFIIGTNLGLFWRDAQVAVPTYAVSLRTALGSKWALYTEFYGQHASGFPSENYFDAALEHWIWPHAVVDLAFGLGVSAGASDYFVSLGGAFRFHPRTK